MSNIQEKNDGTMIIPTDTAITVSDPPDQRIRTAIHKPGEVLNGAWRGVQNIGRKVKGRDLETLIEEFSSDVTLVLGGLSDDQERLGHEQTRLIRDEEQLRRQTEVLERRIAALEKKLEKRQPQDKASALRSLTWLAGVVFGGMALLYVLRFFLV